MVKGSGVPGELTQQVGPGLMVLFMALFDGKGRLSPGDSHLTVYIAWPLSIHG